MSLVLFDPIVLAFILAGSLLGGKGFSGGPCAGATNAPRIVRYKFDVNYFRVDLDCEGLSWVQGINGVLPGPEVRVKRGDRLVVEVVNHLQVEQLTVHWHGFEMRAAQEYDGAMGFTQCGIKPGGTFIYDFIVDEHPGSYMYHEHAELEHVAARGFFGPLIVEPAAGETALYPVEGEATLMLMDWWKKSTHELERFKQARLNRPNTVNAQGNHVGLLPFHNLLINGKGAFNVFWPGHNPEDPVHHVTNCTRAADLAQLAPKAGETWRLRLINGGSMFGMRFRIDRHRLRVIQSDGADVKPYDCDAVSMSSGERFDVLVTFDQAPGSYWFRVETLESGPGLHHGQLGVLRYDGSQEGVVPDRGFPRSHRIEQALDLVTLNCVDQGPISATCRPITDLRRLSTMPAHVGASGDDTHDFEVNLRGFAGQTNAHFVRLLDLNQAPNEYGENQFLGEYTQYHGPHVPYSYVGGGDKGQHPNTLSMHVQLGEVVRVVIQQQDRAAHPWHLHGFKFAVLGTGWPDYEKTCDILYCRSKRNPWISRDGFPGDLLSPLEAPLKDTVYLPAGGWVVIQFKADNPGWWFFHCHMLIHAHDGMGLVVTVGSQEDMPVRLTNVTYLNEAGFPSCEEELHSWQSGHQGLSCNCWQNPEMKLDNLPRSTYKCSQPYLCGHELHLEEESWEEFQLGRRDRAAGRFWRLSMLAGEIFLVLALFVIKRFLSRRQRVKAQICRELVRELKEADESSRFESSVELHSANIVELSGKGTLVNWSTEMERELTNSYDLHFWQKMGSLSGELKPGSIMAIFTEPSLSAPWLHFFAGRRHSGSVKVTGELCFDGVAVRDLDSVALCQARALVSTRLNHWPHSTVAEVLEFPLLLIASPTLYSTWKDREIHMAHFVKLFKIESLLHRRMRELNQEQVFTVLLAQESMLPRGLLVLQEPLTNLQPAAAGRMLHLFKILTQKLKMTIIFSVSTWIPPEEATSITHALVVSKDSPPWFGADHEMRRFFDSTGASMPAHVPVSATMSWASELVVKGMLTTTLESPKRRTSSITLGFESVLLKRRGSKLRRFSVAGTESMSMVAVLSDSQMLRRKQRVHVHRKQHCFPVQLAVLFRYQLQNDLEEHMTVYKVAETFGIGAVTGLVWFRRGESDTETALGEIVGLIFFSTALYTVPPVFQALAATPNIVKRVSTEYINGLYPVSTYVCGMLLSSVPTILIWPAVWQITAYTLAALGSTPVQMLSMHLVLCCNVLTMRLIGHFLALAVPSPMLNVVIGNIFAQFCMLSNGFYTKLPEEIQWVTWFSPPRFAFRALLKLEYSWRDGFQANPMHGDPGLGFPSNLIPAELTGVFQTMRERQMDVMGSPEDSSPLQELLVMVVMSSFFLLLFSLALRWNAVSAQAHFSFTFRWKPVSKQAGHQESSAPTNIADEDTDREIDAMQKARDAMKEYFLDDDEDEELFHREISPMSSTNSFTGSMASLEFESQVTIEFEPNSVIGKSAEKCSFEDQEVALEFENQRQVSIEFEPNSVIGKSAESCSFEDQEVAMEFENQRQLNETREEFEPPPRCTKTLL